jgi:hypothetical protein
MQPYPRHIIVNWSTHNCDAAIHRLPNNQQLAGKQMPHADECNMATLTAQQVLPVHMYVNGARNDDLPQCPYAKSRKLPPNCNGCTTRAGHAMQHNMLLLCIFMNVICER